VTGFQWSCDDPQVGWFCDSTGRLFGTLDGGKTWRDMSAGLMGARVLGILASDRRTFVLWARTDRGLFLTRDGGLSWRPPPAEEIRSFAQPDFHQWQEWGGVRLRISEKGELERSTDGGKTAASAMQGWRIPRAQTLFATSRGWMASGPGGCYESPDGEQWTEMKLWPEEETGAADFLHAYWMGRYYGFIQADE
jgi:hypothetical protein